MKLLLFTLLLLSPALMFAPWSRAESSSSTPNSSVHPASVPSPTPTLTYQPRIEERPPLAGASAEAHVHPARKDP
jgi:hypothetical protein